MDFKKEITQGIPNKLPDLKKYDLSVNHAPIREDILSNSEKKLALKNALRYFDKKFHEELISEFKTELEKYGRIYMYRFKPSYKIYARSINEYPFKSKQAAVRKTAAVFCGISGSNRAIFTGNMVSTISFFLNLPDNLSLIK